MAAGAPEVIGVLSRLPSGLCPWTGPLHDWFPIRTRHGTTADGGRPGRKSVVAAYLPLASGRGAIPSRACLDCTSGRDLSRRPERAKGDARGQLKTSSRREGGASRVAVGDRAGGQADAWRRSAPNHRCRAQPLGRHVVRRRRCCSWMSGRSHFGVGGLLPSPAGGALALFPTWEADLMHFGGPPAFCFYSLRQPCPSQLPWPLVRSSPLVPLLSLIAGLDSGGSSRLRYPFSLPDEPSTQYLDPGLQGRPAPHLGRTRVCVRVFAADLEEDFWQSPSACLSPHLDIGHRLSLPASVFCLRYLQGRCMLTETSRGHPSASYVMPCVSCHPHVLHGCVAMTVGSSCLVLSACWSACLSPSVFAHLRPRAVMQPRLAVSSPPTGQPGGSSAVLTARSSRPSVVSRVIIPYRRPSAHARGNGRPATQARQGGNQSPCASDMRPSRKPLVVRLRQGSTPGTTWPLESWII